MDQLQSAEMLLFATDFPHWQIDGDAMLPTGIDSALAQEDPDRQPARDLSATGQHLKPGGSPCRSMLLPLPAPRQRQGDATAWRSSTATSIPAVKSLACLKPYLEQKWWDHAMTYGFRRRHGSPSVEPYPKSAPLASRRDAWPEDGVGRPGSSLELMQKQYLDPAGSRSACSGRSATPARASSISISGPPSAGPRTTGSAMRGRRQDKRLKAAIVVPYEDGLASAKEIERCGPHGGLRAGVLPDALVRAARQPPLLADLCGSAGSQPAGGFHVFGTSGHPVTGAGWPSYYIEEGAGGHSTSARRW